MLTLSEENLKAKYLEGIVIFHFPIIIIFHSQRATNTILYPLTSLFKDMLGGTHLNPGT